MSTNSQECSEHVGVSRLGGGVRKSTPNALNPLEVAELLEMILEAIPPRRLYKLIFVCRAWAEVCIRIIWRSQWFSPLYIMNLLGPLTGDEQSLDLLVSVTAGDVSPAQWERCMQYARLVQHVQFLDYVRFSDTTFVALSQLAKLYGGSLFPNARYLTLVDRGAIVWAIRDMTSLISGEMLRSLRISCDVTKLLQLLSIAAGICPNLEDISCVTNQHGTVLEFTSFRQWPKLRNLTSNTLVLRPQALSELSDITSLLCMSIAVPHLLLDRELETFGPFHQLVDLKVTVTPDAQDILTSLRPLYSNTLRRLTIEARTTQRPARSWSGMQLSNVVQVAVELAGSLQEVKVIGFDCFTFDQLLPIGRLAQITILHLHGSYPDPTGNSAENWLCSLPASLLHLNIKVERSSALSLQSIITVAKRCQKLTHLWLGAINLNSQLPDDIPTFSPNLRLFSAVLYDRPNTRNTSERVAKALAHMLPKSTVVDLFGGPIELRVMLKNLRNTKLSRR